MDAKDVLRERGEVDSSPLQFLIFGAVLNRISNGLSGPEVKPDVRNTR